MELAMSKEIPRRIAVNKGFVFMSAAMKLSLLKPSARNFRSRVETFL